MIQARRLPGGGGLLLLTALLLFTRPASAGSIGMAIGASVTLVDGKLTVRLRVTNSGDEVAHAVTPVLRFEAQRLNGVTRALLAPGEVMEDVLAVNVGTLSVGRWPVVLAVDYADANRYPFQALHAALVEHGGPSPSPVVVADVSAPVLDSDGTVSVRVRNQSGRERRVRLSVVVPLGIEVREPGGAFALKGGEEQTVAVKVVNRAALVGSRYPVFALVSYEADGVHQSALGQGAIDIARRPRDGAGDRGRRLSWGLAGAIVVIWLAGLVWRARRENALARRP